MTPSAGVTVVMITHNRRDEALTTLEHVTGLPDRGPVIVVDNGSADGTSEAIRRSFPQVTLLSPGRNLGAVGRNLAVDHVNTPYVAFCDDDTRWQPGALSHAAEVLDAHPDLGAVMGTCLVEPDLAEDPLTTELRESPLPRPGWLPGPALLSVLAAVTTFRVSAFRAAGGFSPRLWLGGEEELLSIDMATAGWWACWVEDIRVHHAPSRNRDTRQRRRLGLRNTLWTLWLRRPVRSAARRSAEVLAGAPKDRATARAVLAAVAGAPWVLTERRVVPDPVERNLRMLEEPQRHSRARQYVG